ncbi:MAG: hypothetical protein L6Q98_09520 [Anaerolineae bacterium]|nr:hypothetical protein [Anaerolineae bacterium]NUQ06934.1 hypothetical protein [Anaerolineae bacterium]
MFLMKVCRAGFLIITFGLAAVQALAQDDAAVQAKIDSALSAAPAAITQDATILDWSFDADGKFVVLREGTNGWSCLPDEPTTEVNNPLCFDEAALTWVYALVSGEAPRWATVLSSSANATTPRCIRVFQSISTLPSQTTN